MLTKLVKVGFDWKYLVLSDAEEVAARDKHREASNALMRLALQDAAAIYGDQKPEVLAVIAKALFEKRCDAIYSVLQRELENAAAKLCSGQK